MAASSVAYRGGATSGLQVDQGAEHLICRFHDLRGQSYLMTAGYLFDSARGKNFRVDGMGGNAAPAILTRFMPV